MTIRPLRAADRPQLLSVLEAADDLSLGISGWYRTPKPPHVDFVATNRETVEGVITGTFGSDYRGNDAFDSLDLPPGPHAFLTRIYVSRAARRHGVGLALLRSFAEEAYAHRCTFIAGTLDLSSNPEERVMFFGAAGFVITPDGVIGAGVRDVLERTAELRG